MSFQRVDKESTAQLRIIRPSALSQLALGTARSFLSGPELIRCDNLVSGKARRNFAVGHALARIVVAEQLALEPAQVTLVQTCSTCGGPHGRPHVVDLPVHVSFAYATDAVAVAASRCGPIAVDCADFPPQPHHRDAMVRLLPIGENNGDDREAVKLWTIHECLVKLGGRELDDQKPVHRSPHLQQPDIVLVEGNYFRSIAMPATVATVGSPDAFDLTISMEVPDPLHSPRCQPTHCRESAARVADICRFGTCWKARL